MWKPTIISRSRTQRATWLGVRSLYRRIGCTSSGCCIQSPPPPDSFGMELSAPEIADILYARYRVARVMSVITVGDVYQADAIDRRGYRVRFIVDGDNGAVLDSFMIGRLGLRGTRSHSSGSCSGSTGGTTRAFPSADQVGCAARAPKNGPPKSRQATTPDPGGTVRRSRQAKAGTRATLRFPRSLRHPSRKPEPSTAARPPLRRQEPQPKSLRVTAPAAEPAAKLRHQGRSRQKPGRLIPLITDAGAAHRSQDRPSGMAQYPSLRSTKRDPPVVRDKPITIVPPAPLE